MNKKLFFLAVSIFLILIGARIDNYARTPINEAQKMFYYETTSSITTGAINNSDEQEFLQYLRQVQRNTERKYKPIMYFAMVIIFIGAAGIMKIAWETIKFKTEEPPKK